MQKQVDDIQMSFKACQNELEANKAELDKTQAENQVLKREIDENLDQARDEITSVRKELKDSLGYAKAVEAEKKQTQQEMDQLKSQVVEVKQECTSTLSVKEKVFNQQSLELR